MYTAFYGLREKPFALSPDPRFLYLAGSHREALAHLLYGIEQGEGFIAVTGEVGTGKTTLCRTLLERLEGELELAFLFNPSRTALELLQSICAEFGLPAEGLARRSLMAQLNAFLVEQKRIGRRVLLIIDEAQTLSETTLEQVRLLSNLETSREKLIQILLLGQPELDRKLDARGLRQLRQRISVRWKLEPLGSQETHAYVRHRLAVAAGEPRDLFSEAALREVHRRTGGIPRLVNQLCDRALLAGYASRSAKIGPRLVRAAAREIPDAQRPSDRGGSPANRSPFARPWLYFAASLVIVGLSLFAGLQVGRRGLTDSLRASVFKPAELRTDGEGRSAHAARLAVAGNRSAMHAPAVGATYWGSRYGAFAETNGGAARPIECRPVPKDGLVAVVSRNHRTPETDAFLSRIAVKEETSTGSSLKFCMVAAGRADIYPRFGRTMEWDTAAGHAVVRFAGGQVTKLDGSDLTYGKPGFENPNFIVRAAAGGDAEA